MSTKLVSLEEARKTLGVDTQICLEPETVMKAKQTAGREEQLWVLDLASGTVHRGDQRYFEMRMVDRGGWLQPGLYEEPKTPDPQNGRRVVGNVIVERNKNGLFRVKNGKGLEGDILEFGCSSASKGEDAPAEICLGDVQFNPQRLLGAACVVFRDGASFPDAEGMTAKEFAEKSTDGRSLSALLKILAHLNLIS